MSDSQRYSVNLCPDYNEVTVNTVHFVQVYTRAASWHLIFRYINKNILRNPHPTKGLKSNVVNMTCHFIRQSYLKLHLQSL